MKSSFTSQQYDPVTEREMQTIGQTLLPQRLIGKPHVKPIISTLDIAALVVVMIFFIAAVAAVWVSQWAVLLGQTNQLVVLGFALTVMGFCTNRQIILASLHLEGRYGRSTLQNFDALLRSTPYARNMSISPRMILISLQILPLGLSVAYKRFSGGQSSVTVALQESDWGFVPPPGWTTSGNGLALAVDAYAPFWQDPGVNRTYGYNLYVASNTTAAVLDTPFPKLIERLQAGLDLGEYVQISTTVNATVSENDNLSSSEQDEFFRNLDEDKWRSKVIDMGFDYKSQLMTQDPDVGQIFLSIWHTTSGTFNSTAQRYLQSRRLCTGTWNITSSNITLISARLLDPIDDQYTVHKLSTTLPYWFTVLLPEFNHIWDHREDLKSINTFPPLVASMVWARTIVRWGAQEEHPQSTPAIRTHVKYSKAGYKIRAIRKTITLKRSGLLLFVLAINPILVVLAVTVKTFLYSTPLDEGFGLISLLSGVKRETLDILRGAALSGTLNRDVRLQFDVVDDEASPIRGEKTTGRISVVLDTDERSSTLRRKTFYR